MKWTDLIIYTLLSVIVIYIQLKAYEKLSSKTNIKYRYIHHILIILAGMLITYNTYLNSNALRAYISFGILLFLELIIYKDTLRKTIVYGTISYIFVVISEIILDVFLLVSKIIDLKTIDEKIGIKVLISISISFLAYIIARNSIIKKISDKVMKMFDKSIIPLIILIFSLVAMLVIAFKNISFLTYTNYISSIVLLIIFSIFIIMVIYNEQKVEKEISKTEALLDFMADYERKIEEDRINRHEMLNNLLILKSYSNKNSKKFNETLDELINTYSKKGIDIKNIYKLPSGLKGIIYYKISEVKNKNLNININISKQLSSSLSNLDSNTYTLVCKIVGITFDNAIEASENSNEKIVNFDVYEENNNIVIELSNSYKNKIDLGKINNKNYSTKGKNRGLGLYIVKTLINNNNNIRLEQNKVDKFFITKIYVKNLDKELI